MEDLGLFGFWLAVGAVLAAGAISSARKERDRERQKHETLREMMRLEAEGKLTPETLAYMRARDAAEAKFVREMMGMNMSAGAVAALAIGFLSFMGGCIAMAVAVDRTESWEIPVSLGLGTWAVGLLIAFIIYFAFRGRKNAPPPGP
jgi:hypothetical protein